MSAPPPDHIPVMLEEVLTALDPCGEGVYVDCTLGAAGYTGEILKRAPRCRVVGIDRDPWAIKNAESLRARSGERLILVRGRFSALEDHLAGLALTGIEGVVMDVGVSSVQIDRPERGFSFRADAPLDMRMDSDEATPTAADIVNGWPEAELARIIRDFGEERHARRVAAHIVLARADTPIRTTGELAAIVRRAVPKSPKDPTDQATRTFQALRIAVNDELGELARVLSAAERVLKPGGRLVAVCFHSLEDRIVKDFLTERSGRAARASRHAPDLPSAHAPTFTLPFKKPLAPSPQESAANPRARSARLRAAVRTDAPPWKEAA